MKTKCQKWKYLFSILLFLGVAFGIVGYYFKLFTGEDSNRVNTKFHQLVKEYHIPGAVLSYGFGDHPLKTFVAGYASLQPNEKMSEKNLFFVGSITKSFTAAIILKLTEAHQISLDETLGEFSKKYTGKISFLTQKYPALAPMTIRELLDHTSGVPQSINTKTFKEMFVRNPQKTYSDISLIKLAMQTPVYFKPGDPGKWSYTNTDYILLGLIIRDVTHESLETNFKKLFLQTHLKNIYFASIGSSFSENLKTVAPGHMPSESQDMLVKAFIKEPRVRIPNDKNSPYFYELKNAYSIFSGAASGGVVTNAPTLATWYRALFEKQTILKSHSLHEMLKSVSNGKYDSAGYGLGVATHTYPEIGFTISHDGLEPGYASIVMFFPKYQLVLAVTTNSANSRVSTFDVHNGSIMPGLVTNLLPIILRERNAS